MKVDYKVMYENCMKIINQQKKEIEVLNGKLEAINSINNSKKCSMCKKVLPLTKFGKHSTRGYQGYCKLCHSVYNREFRNKNKKVK